MLKKRFDGKICWVRFSIPVTLAQEAHSVYLKGSFNAWSDNTTPMLRQGNTFVVELPLECDKEYKFLYLIDGTTYDDWNADKYIPSPYGGDDSVVMTYQFVENDESHSS